MTEQYLVNNNVSALNGESSVMTSGNLVLSDLTRNLPYANYSFNFDGATEYINCDDILDFTGDFSLSAWFKTTSDGVIIGKDDNAGGTGDNRKFLLQVLATGKGRFLVFHTNESTFASVETSTNVDDGNWHHLVGVNDTSGNMKIYLDGVDDSASVVSGVTPLNPSTVDLYIGARQFPTSELYFDGNISNPSCFDVKLTSTEVQKLYANGLPQDLTNFTPQPISWWTLGKESFWNSSDWIVRDMIGSNDGTSANMGVSDLVGDAPRSENNGTGTNMDIPTNLVGNAGWSDKNAYSINMSPSARVTDTP